MRGSYRTVPGFPNYRVYTNGSVWSKSSGDWKQLYGGNKKYLRVSLANHGTIAMWNIHALVLTLFSGPCPKGMQSRHLNGNCKDNRRSNLAWGTPKENNNDKVTHGTQPRGESHHTAKMTDEVVLVARKRWSDGEYLSNIAKSLGVNYFTLYTAVRGIDWKHLENAQPKKRTFRRNRLPVSVVLAIRKRVENNERRLDIARIFDVEPATVDQIAKRKTYKSIP